MKKAVCGLCSLYFLTTATAASSEPITSNDLLSACEANDNSVQEGFCVGYVIGVIEGLRYGATVPLFAVNASENVQEIGKMADTFLGFCAPAEAQYSQHREILINYLVAHPESRHESARTLAIAALEEAFPCK